MVGLAVTCLIHLSIPADHFNNKKKTSHLQFTVHHGPRSWSVSGLPSFQVQLIDLQLKLKTSHLLKRNDDEGGEVTPN